MFGVSKCLQTTFNVYVTTKDFTRSEVDTACTEIYARDVHCRPPLRYTVVRRQMVVNLSTQDTRRHGFFGCLCNYATRVNECQTHYVDVYLL